MSEINEDIYINIKSTFDNYEKLYKQLEIIKKSFGGFENLKIDNAFQRSIKDLSLEDISKVIDKVNKEIEVSQDKMFKQIASGKPIAEIEKNIKRLQDRLGTAYKYIYDTGGLNSLYAQHIEREANAMQKVAYNALEQKIIAEDTAQIEAEKVRLAEKHSQQLFLDSIVQRQIADEQAQQQEELAYYAERSNAINSLSVQKLQDYERSLDPVKQKLYELGQRLAVAREEFIKLDKAGLSTKSAEKQIKKINNKMLELEQSTKKTANRWKVLLGRIKNIAIYRTIRTAFATIFRTITQGFDTITKLNRDAEQNALRLKADYNLIATAIGSIGATLLNAFIGPIDKATDSLLELLNSFNKVLAISLGSDKYIEVFRKSIDGLSNSTKKLSFDKFEALNQQDENLLGIGTREIELQEDAVNNLTSSEQNLKNVLDTILTIFGDIYDLGTKIWTGIIKPLLDSGIANALVEIVSWIIQLLTNTHLLRTAILGIVAIKVGGKILSLTDGFNKLFKSVEKTTQQTAKFSFEAQKAEKKTMSWGSSLAILAGSAIITAGNIITLISNWDKMSASSKGWVIAIGVLTAVVASLAFAVYAVKQQWAKAIAVAGGVIATGTTVMTAISGFEKGGIPAKSELFYMNENGVPEALINTGGSETNVINITQLSQGMKQGFIEAIYETGLLDAMQSRIVIEGDSVNDNAFARAIFPALKTESTRRGGNQL